MDPINLNPIDTTAPQVDLSAGQPTSPIPSAGVAKTRAAKGTYGTGNFTNRTEGEAFDFIQNGSETAYRQEAATAADFAKRLQKNRLVEQVLRQYPDAASLAADQFDMAKLTGMPAPTDPEAVIEQYMAGKYLKPMTDISDQFNSGTFMPAAIQAEPETVQREVDKHADILTRQQYFQTRLEQLEQQYNSQSWVGWGADQAKQLVRTYDEMKLRGWTGHMDWSTPLGSALANQSADMYRSPDWKNMFDTAIAKLSQDNPSEAVKFARYMVGAPGDEIERENAATYFGMAADLSVVGGLVRNALKAPIKAIANLNRPGVEIEDIKAAAAAGQGNLAEAAVQKVSKGIKGKLTGTIVPEQQVVDPLPTYLRYDADYHRTNPGRSGQEIANRVAEDTAVSQTSLEDAVNSAMKVQRTPALLANDVVAQKAVNQVKGLYTGPNSSVLDLGDPTVLQYHPGSNHYSVELPLGDADGEFFKTSKQARSWAKFNKISGDVVKQEGNGWYVSTTVNLPETSNAMWDTYLDIPGSFSGPARKAERKGAQPAYLIDPQTGVPSDRTWNVIQAFWNSGGGAFEWRSPREVLSPYENEQRQVATFGPQKLMQMFTENNKIIHDGLSKDLRRILQRGQNLPDPVNPELRGAFYQGIPELEHAFQSGVGRPPTDKEIRAYFATKNNYESERALMSLTEIRNKARNGVMSWQIHSLDRTRETDKATPLKYSDRFDAKVLDHLPKDGDSTFVNLEKQYIKQNTKLGGAEQEINELIRSGQAKVLELWNRDTNPIHKFSDVIKPKDSPRYIVTDKFNFEPLDFQSQVKRRGGGHLIPEYSHYIKMADIYFDETLQKYRYRGDITFSAARNVAEGQEISDVLNKMHEHMIAGDENGARKIISDTGIAGLDFDKHILPRYQATTKPFNVYDKFRVIPKDQTIASINNDLSKRFLLPDTDKNALIDGTKHGNLSRTATVAFNEPRDAYELHSFENHGTPRAPLWQYRPAKLLDPIDALNRSMTALSNSFFMDDYRVAAGNHWLANFGQWLEKADYQAMRESPLYAFYKGTIRKDAPEHIKLLAESNRKKALDFIRTPNVYQTMVNRVGQSLMDSIYRNAGGKYIPFTELPWTKDPLAVVRGLVMDMKLGLGAVPQFFLQAASTSNVFALAPKQSASAAMATLFHQWARVNPTIIDHLDERASTGFHLKDLLGFQGWKPGQLKEAWNLGNTTSFFHVGSEHASLDNMLKDRGVGNMIDAARYWGRTFFREGSGVQRTTAWYSAYLQMREIKPTGALTRADEHWILDRASLFDSDMNRANNSAINSGVMSIPGMFYTYTRNLSEQFYGKRLTPMEKAILFAANAMFWGVPAGLALGGLPFGEYVRKKAIEEGYVPGDNPITTTFYDGMFATMGAYITGKGNFQAGRVYDFSRYGPNSYGPINTAVDQDKTVWDLIGGAPYSVLKNTAFRSQNFLSDVADLIHGGDKFRFKGQDIADVFKEASGFSDGWKVYMAVAYHNWMSNNNTPLERNVGLTDALFRGLTGLVPTEISDLNIYKNISSDRTEYVKKMTSMAARNFNLALLAKKQGDDQGYIDFMRKGNAWLAGADMPPDKRTEALHQIFTRKPSLVEGIQWSISHQNVPENKQDIEQQRAMVNEYRRRQREGQ